MWRRGLPFLVFATLFFLACLLTRNAAAQGGYEYVPLATPATSTSWDGDAKSASETIDLQTVFGLPAGIKGISAVVMARDETVGVTFGIGRDSSYPYAIGNKLQVANQTIEGSGISACDGNGDVRWGETDEVDIVYILIYGYFVDPVPTATAVPTETAIPADTPEPTHTLVPTDTPEPTHTLVPTATAGWYVLTLTPPSGGGSSYDPDPFDTVITQTLSSGNQWAFVRDVDTGEILIGALALAILAVIGFRGVSRS